MFLIVSSFLAVFTVVNLKYSAHPYIWEGLLSGVCFIYFARNAQSSAAKTLFYNLAVFLLCIGLLEAGASVLRPNHERTEYSQNYYDLDDILGFAPKKNTSVSCRKYLDRRLLYDISYTINKDGLRAAPLCRGIGCKNSILFFGCSFTYGEGVNDDETTPFLVGKVSGSKVYNFGFHGYGPHQMLSAIEHGLVEKVVDSSPRYAFYQTAAFHVARASGNSSWDWHGPKYILTADGKIKYDGHFDDPLIIRVRNFLLKKSAIYQNFIAGRCEINQGGRSEKDIDRYVAIIKAAKNELQRKFPGLEFYVIYWSWDYSTAQDRRIVERLHHAGIEVYYITDILPDFKENPGNYTIPIDGHPNLVANRTIANYIVQHFLQVPAR